MTFGRGELVWSAGRRRVGPHSSRTQADRIRMRARLSQLNQLAPNPPEIPLLLPLAPLD